MSWDLSTLLQILFSKSICFYFMNSLDLLPKMFNSFSSSSLFWQLSKAPDRIRLSMSFAGLSLFLLGKFLFFPIVFFKTCEFAFSFVIEYCLFFSNRQTGAPPKRFLEIWVLQALRLPLSFLLTQPLLSPISDSLRFKPFSLVSDDSSSHCLQKSIDSLFPLN